MMPTRLRRIRGRASKLPQPKAVAREVNENRRKDGAGTKTKITKKVSGTLHLVQRPSSPRKPKVPDTFFVQSGLALENSSRKGSMELVVDRGRCAVGRGLSMWERTLRDAQSALTVNSILRWQSGKVILAGA